MIELSPYHETFFNEWKLNPVRSDYNIVFDNELHGEMDPDRMDHALVRLSQDFHFLHSKIEEINGKCYWVVAPDLCIKFKYFDHPLDDRELTAFAKSPFNLHKEVLLRVALIKLAERKFRLILVFHHLIIDSSKTDFVSNILPRYYNGENIVGLLPLKEQQARLSRFSEKYLQWLRETEDGHKKFWCQLLNDLPGVDLAFMKPVEKNIDVEEDALGTLEFTLDSTVLNVIKQAARKHVTTPYLLTLSIFVIALFRHTQQHQMGLCLPIAIPDGREFIYGSNISPTIFFIELNHASTVSEVIEAAKKYFKLIKSENHYHYPFQRLSSSKINKDLFHTSFIQSSLKDIRTSFQGVDRQFVNTALNIDMAGKLVFAQEIKNSDELKFRVTYKKNMWIQICCRTLSNYTNVCLKKPWRIWFEILRQSQSINTAP